jgi:tRNA(Ile)-lysidine synthase
MSTKLTELKIHPEAAKELQLEKTWVIALSGGVDSVGLLFWAHTNQNSKKIKALHFNHNLRGNSSDTDETFCKELCQRLNVEFISQKHPIEGELKTEERARNARREFFKQNTTATEILLTGHHANDVAETMVLQLVRGGSTSSLASPRPNNKPTENLHIVRPFLNLTKKEITEFVNNKQKEHVIKWREDTSNPTDDYLRNKVRHHILPKILEVENGRNVLKGLLTARSQFQEDADALDNLTSDFFKSTPQKLVFLNKPPKAIIRRILHIWLNETNEKNNTQIKLQAQGFNQLIELCEQNSPHPKFFCLGQLKLKIQKQTLTWS